MSKPIRRHSKSVIADHTSSQAAFVQAVAQTIRQAGFDVLFNAHRMFDLSFRAANGDLIGVECGLRSVAFRSDKQIELWLSQQLKLETPVKEILIVSLSFPNRVRGLLNAYWGVEMVTYERLPQWLERYKPPLKPKRQSRTIRIASTIKTNRDQIIVTTEALALQIEDKLAQLKVQNPNSPEAIAKRDGDISDYEALRAQVEDLKKAAAKLTASAQSKEQVAKTAVSFGEGVQGWWNKHHTNILDRSAEMGVVLTAVGILSLIGVNPTIAMAASTALVGGRSVAKALKGVIKVHA